ncbi:Mpp10 protein [Daedalea quercina L-15889]|uniref:Mpp10 protein n=1 Tax=Daedalea quercina L-15889 TaxID=1314783 RepID=A0A165UB45_9APHY|nr:Mpp10 protein [Daedalea quercina L-15889]
MATEDLVLPPQLERLTLLIDEKPEALALGDNDLRVEALKATKYLYDLALKSEAQSRGHIVDLLSSISPSLAPQTRSQTAARHQNAQPELHEEAPDFEPTPVTELFIEGMDGDQIWSQMELRAENVCRALQYALDGMDEGAEDEEEDEEEEEGDDEARMEMMRQAMERGEDIDMELDGMDVGVEDGTDDAEAEDESENESEDDPEVHLGEDVVELRDPSDEDDREDEDEEDEMDEEEYPLDFGLELDTEQTVLFLNHKRPPPKRKGRAIGHPELDDGFFDLVAFNRETEEAESRAASKGRLGKKDSDDEDEDMEDDVDLFAPVDGVREAFDEEDLEGDGGELFYQDFFEPPARTPQANAEGKGKARVTTPRGKVRFHDEVKVRMIKAKGKNLPTSSLYAPQDDDEDDEDDDEDGDYEYNEENDEDDSFGEGSDKSMGEDNSDDDGSEDDHGEDEGGSYEDDSTAVEGEDGGLETMERFKDDLFAEEEDTQQDMSMHQKRMAALREEIAALEAENVAKKDWTLMGEATSRSRPQNSLLEEDLEYERVTKSVPVITEEVVQSLEERIKARVLENQFDDVVRRRPVDDKPFLPSRFFELQDTKSKQSLAELYEDEYTTAQTGGAAGEDRDGKLKKEHEEIEKLWEQISGKLDALCNAHFTPKAPKASISTVSNVAAASMESALPTIMSTSSMLAPEEVLQPPSAKDLQARSELTPAQKRALRNKDKKAKKKARDALEKSVDKFAQSRRLGSVKRQKEAALKSVVKSGKGVTVVGKQAKDLKAGKQARTKP